MARVTTEDCIKKIPNRFELCMIVSERVREMCTGALSVNNEGGEKASVIALREIGSGSLNYDVLREKIIEHMRLTNQVDDASEVVSSTYLGSNPEDELIEMYVEEELIFSGEEEFDDNTPSNQR
jgi:DNA-directed RNA polymerase subunit omega